ncbi:AAA family ATPase [Apiospora phragmitis]|uniref:AAA family ATPase n=1 Tax=Apiospora phragmitis TaxID=2905665 RepID=A0ABR1VVE3_9PEZI
MGCFRIAASYVDHNGYMFGFATINLDIASFTKTKKITSLNVHPTSFRDDEGLMKQAIWARGKRFYDLRGVQYKAYRGSCLLADEYIWGTRRKQLDGRVVIDASLAPPLVGIGRLVSLDDPSVAPTIHVDEQPSHQTPRSQRRYQPAFHDPTPHPGITSRYRSIRRETSSQRALETASGANWLSRLYRRNQLERERVPNLRLPEGHKGLILAFVDGQLSDSQPFDGIIQGKGLGLTMLLAGSPGTGKTLTAEAVADRLRKPLYVMSAGELGQSAASVERELNITLEMTEKTLEYYTGMLFLTTNRGDAIDAAFQSRIHLTLQYPELSTDAKTHIWNQFLSRAPSSAVTTLEVSNLALLPLNGRQIKNIVKTASLLARS